MIRRWLEKSWGFWRGASAAGALFLALLAVILLVSGTLPPARLRDAARTLAGKGPAPLKPTPAPGEAEWKRLGEAQRQAEAVLQRRRAEVEKLDAVASSRLAYLQEERRRLEEARRAGEEAEGRLRRRQEEMAAAGSDAEMQANLPIFARMDGPAILALVKGWDDARLARYLRAMRPGKAAEVLEAMRLDPQFGERTGRLMEELKRPPAEEGR